MIETAEALWSRLDGQRTEMLRQFEEYSALTIRRIMLKPGHVSTSDELAKDYQSIGAAGVTNVVNKLMLTMFNPTKPFFRLGFTPVGKAIVQAQGVPATDAETPFSAQEREGMEGLAKKGYRVKLYSAMTHLVVTGNVLIMRAKNAPRVMGVKYWCVKRNVDGSVNTLIIREHVSFDELSKEVQAGVPTKKATSGKDDKVCYYRVFRISDGVYKEEQWVDEVHLTPARFDKTYPAGEEPFVVATWNLEDEADYGNGLVEEYANDLRALSAMSTATVEGVIGLLNWRLLVNPNGVTKADDFKRTRAGDAIPGTKEDIDQTSCGSPEAVAQALNGMTQWERRVARGFMLMSGVTRDAERVTAEELRLQAMELDTNYGGTYSSIASQVQTKIAEWLLDDNGFTIYGSEVEVTIITGLDALSRNVELENLRAALGDLAMITSLPQEAQNRLKMDELIKFIGQGRGVNLERFVRNEQEYRQFMDDMQSRMVDQQTAIAQGEAAAKGQQK